MTPASRPRWYRLTPDRLLSALLAVEGLLWLCGHYRWFWFNHHKGWAALIAVAAVGAFLLLMLLWLVAAALFRWRCQYSIRSLLILTVAVAVPCSWLAVEVKKAKEQGQTVGSLRGSGQR